MSADVVFIAGSPASSSRSSFVADTVAAYVRQNGLATRSFSIRDFDPADVLLGRVQAPAVAAFLDAAKKASAVVVSSPVYKATYAGTLKALVDLIAPDALAGKPALGIATTRLPAHGSEVSRAYLALFGFFQANVLDSLVVLDEELKVEAASMTLSHAARERSTAAAHALVVALQRT
jgi:FMN reductase